MKQNIIYTIIDIVNKEKENYRTIKILKKTVTKIITKLHITQYGTVE